MRTIALVALILVAGCKTTTEAESESLAATSGTTVPSGMPLSIKGKAPAFGALPGIVISLKAGAFGPSGADEQASEGLSAALRATLHDRHAAGQSPFFMTVAVDTSAALSGALAASKLNDRNAESTQRISDVLGGSMSAEQINSQILFYVNDSAKTYRQFFADTNVTLSAAVVDAHGVKLGTYAIPSQQAAALAELQATLDAVP